MPEEDNRHEVLIAGNGPAGGLIMAALTTSRPPSAAVAPPKIGLVSMTKKPVALETWLSYHREHCGICAFYLRVEDTPELAQLLDAPPWDSCVTATYASGHRDYFEQMTRQDAHIESVLPRARAAGLEYLLHVDDDELLYCADGLPALHAALARAPASAGDLHMLNLEALLPHTEVVDPFREDSAQGSQSASTPMTSPQRPLSAWQAYALQATTFRHKPGEFCAYSNGKALGRLAAPDLRPAGPHHFARGYQAAGSRAAGTHELPPSVGSLPPIQLGTCASAALLTSRVRTSARAAVVLHYESGTYDGWKRKYADLAARHGASAERIEQRAPSAFYSQSMAAMAVVGEARRSGDSAALAAADAAARAVYCSWKLPAAPPPPPRAAPLVLREHGVTVINVFAQPTVAQPIAPPPPPPPPPPALAPATADASAAADVPPGLLRAYREGVGGDLSELLRLATIDGTQLARYAEALAHAAGSDCSAGALMTQPERLDEVAKLAKLPIGLRLRVKHAANRVQLAAGAAAASTVAVPLA
jgi:hypothetical protein